MIARQTTTADFVARIQRRDYLVPLGLLGAAALCLISGGWRALCVPLLYVPIVFAGFRSRSFALVTAALASALFLTLYTVEQEMTPETAARAGVEVVVFFGLALLVSEGARRRAVWQARLDEETRAQRASMDVQHMISAACDTDVTLDLVMLKLRDLIPSDSCAVLLADNNILRVRSAGNLPDGARDVRLGVYEEDHGWIPADGGSLIIADTATTPSRLSELDPAARSLLAVPLQSVERLVGLLFIGSRRRDAFTSEMLARAEEFANRIVFPIQRALLEEDLRRLAFTDAQTNLYNHRHFQTLLEEEILRAQRYGRSVALIFLDLDDFKSYNDTYGHPAGDALLRVVSEVLRSNLRSVDMAARYGGEEFVVILPETTSEQAAVLAERLRAAVEAIEPEPAAGLRRRVTVSAGVAAFPENAQNKSDLIAAADNATYEAKRAGKNRVYGAAGILR